MMIKGIKDVFFDLDHTLWDFDKNSYLAFKAVFNELGVCIDIENFLEAYRPVNLKYWKLYREEKVSKSELRRGRLIDTFNKLNQNIPVKTIDAISDSYIAFLPDNNYLIHGTVELLEYLNPKYSLHIITNGFEEVQNRKLTESGIIHFFDTVTNSEEVGVKKPNPLIFERALRKSSADLETSIMIGDNYEADILGAESLGLQTICFNYHKEKIPVHNIQVSDLIQIKNYI